ncbi:MAG: hypothetical protein H6757_03155 [Candidatus Omnitrophica bacterium]|nr:hypothetical protein [Candidatus Omnitrophota bacterium]
MKRKPPKEFFTTWIFEAFDRDPDFFQKRMFGGLSAYLRGRMVMVLVEDPGEKSYRGKSWKFDIWDGIMLPTEKMYHEALQKEFPGLIPHPVLGKWLYLPARDENFETRAREVAEAIAAGDLRFGIEPKMKKSKK